MVRASVWRDAVQRATQCPRGVRLAGADGKPAELLRHQRCLPEHGHLSELPTGRISRRHREPRGARLLRRRRGTRHRSPKRRRLLDVLQRQSDPQHRVRPKRLPVHRRVRSGHGEWQRVAVRPDVLRDRRRHLRRTAARGRRPLVRQRRDGDLDRLQPDGYERHAVHPFR